TGTSDRDLWHFCQSRGVYLLTDNRNASGRDSLEETIHEFNTFTCLPVFTISDRDRLINERSYAERVIATLFDRLIDAENLKGTGGCICRELAATITLMSANPPLFFAVMTSRQWAKLIGGCLAV